MTEFNEIANTPITVELMGKPYKVRRVSLDTIFGKAEAAVISQQMSRIHEMASHLEADEKTSFLAKAMMDSIPSGEKLNQMATSFLKSTEGVKMVLIAALKKDQPNVEEEIEVAKLMTSEADKVTVIIKFATGRGDTNKSALPLDKAEKVSLTVG